VYFCTTFILNKYTRAGNVTTVLAVACAQKECVTNMLVTVMSPSLLHHCITPPCYIARWYTAPAWPLFRGISFFAPGGAHLTALVNVPCLMCEILSILLNTLFNLGFLLMLQAKNATSLLEL